MDLDLKCPIRICHVENGFFDNHNMSSINWLNINIGDGGELPIKLGKERRKASSNRCLTSLQGLQLTLVCIYMYIDIYIQTE